jgi:hypothetical protein
MKICQSKSILFIIIQNDTFTDDTGFKVIRKTVFDYKSILILIFGILFTLKKQ